jgi:methionyl-tRNA formyltransferase
VLLPPERPRRLAYLGSPALAVPPLRALVDAGHEVVLVVSRPDARRGRGGDHSPSPVKAAALELGLPVSDAVSDVVDAGADLGVVVAYGQLIRSAVLEQLAFVNLHFSLLPRWRGAAPVERAILAGDRRTGVCLMGLEETLDTGAVYRRAEVEIGEDETLEQLRARLVDLGTELLLDALAQGFGPPEPQLGEPTLAPKVEVAELHLDWTRPAQELQRLVRLDRAWTTFRGKRLLVRAARLPSAGAEPRPSPPPEPGTIDGALVAAGDGSLELLEVQAEGRGRQPASEWLRGVRPAPGELLGR